MGLNRNFLMGQNVDLKNIKAMMTVGKGPLGYGFQNSKFGSLSPNPLPNGVLVADFYSLFNVFRFMPASIKSCTINNITVMNEAINADAASYLKQNNSKTIPVIFHFN